MCCEREPREVAARRSVDCDCAPSFRRFYSTQEERKRLESYGEELRNELAGVEERLNELDQK